MFPFPPPPPAFSLPQLPTSPAIIAEVCRLTLDLPFDGLTDAEMHDFRSCVVVGLWRAQ